MLVASAGFVLGMLMRRRRLVAVLCVALAFAGTATGAEQRWSSPTMPDWSTSCA